MSTTTDRTTSIGASEAAAAIGVSPWKSRFALWAEKTGQIEPDNLDDVERVQWGNYLQPKIGEVLAEKTGRTVRQNRSNVSRVHPRYPWMSATPDGLQRVNGGPIGDLEIKTTNEFNADQWKTEPPLHYQVQLVHQMLVTGHAWGTLAVLIGGQKLVWRDFVQEGMDVAGLEDPIIVSHLLAKGIYASESYFWQLVESRTPPPIDGSADTAEALKRLYGVENGQAVELPAEAEEWDRELQQAKEQIKALEGIKREHENLLKGAIGAATYGLLPDGSRYQWKGRERNEPAREARTITYRELRRLKK